MQLMRYKNPTKKIITEEIFNSYLSTASFPYPDLCIRTGHEKRISNFLLWQLAYSELYFPDLLWPDFDDNQFEQAINEYAKGQEDLGINQILKFKC